MFTMCTINFTKIDSNDIDEKEIPFQPFDSVKKPLLGKPKEIGFFSIDAHRNILLNRCKMKHLISSLKTDNLCIDLNVNFDVDIIHNYNTLEKMHQTLHWILENEKSQNSHYRSHVDFITVRGTLVLVMCTPYAKGSYHSQWEICATKFNGTIYFSAIDTDLDKAEQTNASLKYLLCQSWGYKFEQYMTTDTIDGNPDIWSTTHQLEEYCIMLENILNSHSLLYKAEIDAVVPHRFPRPGSGDTTCYTELKTSRSLTTIAQDYNFRRHKLVAWWAQSLLAGIPEIICGMRNDNGIVNSLKIFRVSSIPNDAKGLWSPDTCIHFCDKFLTFLKRTVTEDNPNVVYKFHYKGEGTVYCEKIINPSSRYRILPQWYISNRSVDKKNHKSS